jgi:hypothetical protein
MFNKLIVSYTTAFLGTGFMIKGFTMTFMNKTMSEANSDDPVVWSLLAALIVGTVAGTIV